tara:strand:- start:169 stop:522 length:354 start_codon:yes stop_codon:yes gene_type:complete
MKDIIDTTYYEIDTEAFEYSPYAPVSDEKVKLSRKYWKSKSEKEYYEYMLLGIENAIEYHRFKIITTDILDTMRYSLFAHPFEDGGACKKLRVFYSIDKQQIVIDWKFNGKSYEVFI